ncbi:DUF1652 domain-containing protein [Pseudomonas sp. RIT-PI-AD]|uniref:DUF1652 domain-containing protein n=1 Tax=Pseudomonas sp. RIT-PI-AD TaxID=3035294 RepID=UPI0021D90F39|nr:DUF1652 domain-containing protein [Pseudomonas sp. RIT-PI-AD]
MTHFSFPRACELMRSYFKPLDFTATLDSPRSLRAQVMDPASGDVLLTVTGIACSTQLSLGDIERIVSTVRSDLQALALQRILPQAS